MSDKSKDILKKFGESLVKDVAKAVPSATGKTAKSVNIKFTKTGFIIAGGEQIGAIIDGRKPTKNGAKKGNPTVQQSVLEWIKAKSIRPKESNMTQESLSWAISKSIHKKGYKGKGNIFKDVITASKIASLSSLLIKDQAAFVQSQIIKEFKL